MSTKPEFDPELLDGLARAYMEAAVRRVLSERESAPQSEQSVAAERLQTELGWTWSPNAQYPDCIELFNAQGKMLAWITRRPGYCDRGHWAAHVEAVPGLDEQDEFPRYFMRKTTAQTELVEFLAWRLLKRRAE